MLNRQEAGTARQVTAPRNMKRQDSLALWACWASGQEEGEEPTAQTRNGVRGMKSMSRGLPEGEDRKPATWKNVKISLSLARWGGGGREDRLQATEE